jgi:hypothetical protein
VAFALEQWDKCISIWQTDYHRIHIDLLWCINSIFYMSSSDYNIEINKLLINSRGKVNN